MAKSALVKEDIATPVDAKPKRPPVDKSARKIASLLKEVGTCYREAGAALLRGDDAEYAASLELANTYLALVAKLSEKASDAVTAEGLATVTTD